MSYLKEARNILTALRGQQSSGATRMQIQDQLIDGLKQARGFSELAKPVEGWNERQRHRIAIFDKLLKKSI